MPPRQLTWRRLGAGVGALVVMIGLALSILIFARVGGLHGRTYHLYVVTDEARGVLKGTSVWLAGRKVGLVSQIGFRPVSAATDARVVVRLDVLRDYQNQIRRDSRVAIRTGGSFLGAPVIQIGVGMPTSRILTDGDSLPETKQLDVEAFTTQLALATRQLPEIIHNVRRLSRDMQGMLKRFGDLDADRTGGFSVVAARASHLTRQTGVSKGTLGLALSDRELITRVQRATASADSILHLLDSGERSFGRFRRDSTLLRSLGDARDEISIVRARLAESRGTAGRAVRDSAIVAQLHAFEQGLGSVIADVKRHPLRYIAF